MKKVLLIDDSPDFVELLKWYLMKTGLDVVTASDGYAGLILAEEHLPDLIISDVHMPNMDGCGFLMELMKKDSLKDIPVIVLSGNLNLEEKLKDKNIVAFLGKPLKMSLFLEKVFEILGIENDTISDKNT